MHDFPLAELLPRAQAGDLAARDQVLAWLRDRLRPRARHIRGKLLRMDESDALQETCLRVVRAFDRIEPDCPVPKLLAWAGVILDHVVADQGRRAGGRREGPQDGLSAVEGDATGPEDRAIRQERQLRLEQALRELPEQQQMAFHLRLREGLTFEQVGERMGVRLGRARVLFLRAVERLREVLGEPSE